VAVFARSTYFGRDSGHGRKKARSATDQMLCSAGQEISREIEIGDFVNAETWRILLGLYVLSRPQAAFARDSGTRRNFSRFSTDKSFLPLSEISMSSPVKVRGMSSMIRRIREG
jgi:hypothetical protein